MISRLNRKGEREQRLIRFSSEPENLSKTVACSNFLPGSLKIVFTSLWARKSSHTPKSFEPKNKTKGNCKSKHYKTHSAISRLIYCHTHTEFISSLISGSTSMWGMTGLICSDRRVLVHVSLTHGKLSRINSIFLLLLKETENLEESKRRGQIQPSNKRGIHSIASFLHSSDISWFLYNLILPLLFHIFLFISSQVSLKDFVSCDSFTASILPPPPL